MNYMIKTASVFVLLNLISDYLYYWLSFIFLLVRLFSKYFTIKISGILGCLHILLRVMW